MADQNILDKSMRSVFGMLFMIFVFDFVTYSFQYLYYIFSVGNIPYEATEEKLKDIFNEVGPVISFKYKKKFFPL